MRERQVSGKLLKTGYGLDGRISAAYQGEVAVIAPSF
jgi:hypothetical protein